ncbi:MAG TPA: hypothetical protein VFX50_13505, partial [Gemmatimonadales bacterium]|nr:hypothetical protein [Gemmatimonadales bacterium]
MFIGHFALAFAAKRAAPRASLGALFAAAQWSDLLWPVLLLAGVERVTIAPGDTAFTPLRFDSYPVSHSLLAVVAWSLGAAALYVVARRDRRTALVLALLVASHWALDALTHRPDLPLTLRGTTRVGLGLWRSVPATLLVEGAMFIGAIWLYTRTTAARDGRGRWGAVALVAFLGVTYLANVVGPPPPSEGAVAWVTLSMWLLVAWAAWVDRHRVMRAP